MAKCDIQMPEEFLAMLRNLGEREDEIAEAALKAGGKVVLSRVQANLSGSIGHSTKYPSRATGQLMGSLGLTTVKTDRNGDHNIKVGFSEPRSDGGSNAKLANILEYGKHGQPSKPFLKPAKSASKAAAISAMQQKLQEEVDKL